MDGFDQAVAAITGDLPRSPQQARLIWALTNRLACGPSLNEFDLTIVHQLFRLTGRPVPPSARKRGRYTPPDPEVRESKRRRRHAALQRKRGWK